MSLFGVLNFKIIYFGQKLSSNILYMNLFLILATSISESPNFLITSLQVNQHMQTTPNLYTSTFLLSQL